MKIQIINGPNLNLLGRREPDIYGNESFVTYFERLKLQFPDLELSYFQSNSEGELITQVQMAGHDCDFIVLNAGGYSHTSVALADAVGFIPAPTIEVHISNIHAREEYRRTSLTAQKAAGCIVGLGLESYYLALVYCTRAGKR